MIRRVLPCLLVCGACTGTDTGNPYTQPITIDAYSTDTSAVSLSAGGQIEVATAWLVLDSMTLRDAADCSSNGTNAGEISALGAADHAVPQALARQVEVTSGDFCGVDVPFILAGSALPNEAPPELEQNSIVITGTTTEGTDFLIASDFVGAVEVRGAQDFELNEDLGALFIGFDVATWLSAVDIDSGTASLDGVVRIDADNNAQLLSGFTDNIASGVDLYRDPDSDGSIDPAVDPLLGAGQ